MIIKSLALENFRNYENLHISFSDDINLFYGNNAQGKTNILEAIYLLATTKSHRKSNDKEIIKFSKSNSFIKGIFIEKNLDLNVELQLSKNEKKNLFVNKLKLSKIRDYIGKINIIFFSPEDLKILKSSPNVRRLFIDMEICQINKIYMDNLSLYKKVLENRNTLLKKISFNENKNLLSSLDIWDRQLINYGIEIIRERKKFIDDINIIANDLHKIITNSNQELKIVYKYDVCENIFEEEIKKARSKDIKYLCTSKGPHRDDIDFYIDGVNTKIFGSQGQQRTVALVLKLAEINILKNKYNKKPILLLDDVLSELDKNRQKMLLNAIKDIQVFITCTGVEDFINQNLNIGKIYRVENGAIIS